MAQSVIDWTDGNLVRAYRAGYMRASRATRSIRKEATPLAKRVMMNEIARARQDVSLEVRVRKLREGNDLWKALRE